jgi:hypothetical protein
MVQDARATERAPDERAAGAPRRPGRLLAASATILALCGLLALGNAFWIVLAGLPFNGPGGFAQNFGMTRAEVEAFNPQLAWWTVHHYQRLAEVSLGWGLFVIALAAGGIRRGERLAWWALWVGATPTLLSAAFRERIIFGRFDPGSIASLIVLLLFLVGMLLPMRTFARRAWRA